MEIRSIMTSCPQLDEYIVDSKLISSDIEGKMTYVVMLLFLKWLTMNELDIEADWWFPRHNIKFNGRLMFSDKDGGRLVLVGSQEPFILLDADSGQTDSIKQANSDKTCKRNTQQKLILGETKDRERITIIYTLEPSTTSVIKNQYSYVERSYEIDFIFIGTHFETVDDIKFENILVEYSNLPSWMTNSEMIGSTIMKSNKSENKYTMEHGFGKRLDVVVDNRCSIQFLSYQDIRIDFAARNKVSNLPYVLISSIGKQTLEEYIELKNILQDFLNLINVGNAHLQCPLRSLHGIIYLPSKASKVAQLKDQNFLVLLGLEAVFLVGNNKNKSAI